MPSSLGAADLLVAAPPGVLQSVRLWASFRGQTLARTVRGIMQYDAALRPGMPRAAQLDGADVAELVCSSSTTSSAVGRSVRSSGGAGPCGRRCRLLLLRAYPGLKGRLPRAAAGADAEAEEKHDAVLLRSGHNGARWPRLHRVRLLVSRSSARVSRRIRMLGSRLREGNLLSRGHESRRRKPRPARQPPLLRGRVECTPTARLSTSRRP